MPSTQEQLLAAIEAGDADRVQAILGNDPTASGARDEHGVSALLLARYRSDEAMVDAIRAQAGRSRRVRSRSVGRRRPADRTVDLRSVVVRARSGTGSRRCTLRRSSARQRRSASCWSAALGRRVGSGVDDGTALHSAASGRHADVIALLLGAGADPNARQTGGWTPLHAATANGDEPSVRLLLDAGADPAATNDDGQPASG